MVATSGARAPEIVAGPPNAPRRTLARLGTQPDAFRTPDRPDPRPRNMDPRPVEGRNAGPNGSPPSRLPGGSGRIPNHGKSPFPVISRPQIR
jgi:hypothetical protein